LAKNKVKPKKECINCKKNLIESNFYKCDLSPLFPDGRFHICSKCLGEMMDGEDGYQVALMALHAMNKPMLKDIWSDSDHPRSYFRQINSLPNYKGMTWNNSDFESNKKKMSKKDVSRIEIDDDIIDKYGIGYTDEEYRAFEKKYNKLIKNYTEQTAMHREGLVTYIRYRVKEEMSTATGNSKEAKEWGTLAQKAAQDAKLNVSQLSKSDISGGVDLMTQLSEAVESELSVIPLLPKVLEQPFDDVDLIMWANINYNRRLEDKRPVEYREIWNFYDEMIDEYCNQKGMTKEGKAEFIGKRRGVFRDLSDIYVEPLYDEDE